MASIKTSGSIAVIRGSQGGTVYSQNANGAYTRNRSKASNPNTTKQRSQRNIFGGISRTWRTLNESSQDTWISQAPNYPYVNRLGESSIYTGFQLFQAINGRLLGIGEPFLEAIGAPETLPFIQSIEYNIGDVSASELNFHAIFSDLTSVVPAGTKLVVWATIFKSAGFYRPKKSDFRKATVLNATTDVDAENLFASVTAISGAPTVGKIQYVQFQLVSTVTGQFGASVWVKVVWAA